MNPNHHRTLTELFNVMRKKMTKVYEAEIERVAFMGEPTQEQKLKAYAKMDEAGTDLLKKMDYKNHPYFHGKGT